MERISADEVIKEYTKMWEEAKKKADEDVKKYPLSKYDLKNGGLYTIVTKHFINILTIYMGNPNSVI